MLARLRRVARHRLRAVLHRDALDAALVEELAFHIEELTREFMEQGLSASDARFAARRAIGNVPLLEEQARDTRRVAWLFDVRQDVIYALRTLRKSPGFATVAVLSLALGIGAYTALVSVVNSVLREGLPFSEEDRLVLLRTFPRQNPQQETLASLAEYLAWRDESRSFERIGASIGNQADFGSDRDGASAERVQGHAVTGDTLDALGVQPLLGRLFTAEETRLDAPQRVIIVSHRLWQRRFGSRPDIIGSSVRVNRAEWMVIGVMPQAFRFPNEVASYWVPFVVDRSQALSPERFFVVTARLKAGVTIEQAQQDVAGISARLARTQRASQTEWSVRATPVREALYGWTMQPLVTLGGAVALVLLVACANVAGLLMARGVVRAPEMALRAALGAGRGRLVRQLLTESLVLAAVGGVLGVAVAWGGIQSLAALRPTPGGVAIPDIGLPVSTLAIAGLVTAATALLFGIAPALLGARTSRAEIEASTPGTSGGTDSRLRGALVAVQIGITVVLLVGAGLLTRSASRLVSRELNFDPARLLSFELYLPPSEFMRRIGSVGGLPYFEISPPPAVLFERLHRQLRSEPGVTSVAGVSTPLLNSLVVPSATIALHSSPPDHVATPAAGLVIGMGTDTVHVSSENEQSAAHFLVTPGFFAAMRARVIAGRDIGEGDHESSPWVVVVNETAARTLWPGAEAVGQRLTLPVVPDERPRTVVGVVRDIPLALQQTDSRPAIYTSYLQQPSRYPLPGANMLGRMMFMVRGTADPAALVPAVRRIVAAADPDWPMANVTTMTQQITSAAPQRWYLSLVIGAFANTAMLLAAIGLYGVMSYSVARRTREIGLRVALGAAMGDVVRMVGARALRLVVVGLGAGLLGAALLTRLLRSQLWGVTPTDPVTYAGVTLLVVFMAFLACAVPIRRAIGVNPSVALRCE